MVESAADERLEELLKKKNTVRESGEISILLDWFYFMETPLFFLEKVKSKATWVEEELDLLEKIFCLNWVSFPSGFASFDERALLSHNIMTGRSDLFPKKEKEKKNHKKRLMRCFDKLMRKKKNWKWEKHLLTIDCPKCWRFNGSNTLSLSLKYV